MKDQVIFSFFKTTNSMFVKDNYLDEAQDTEFKRKSSKKTKEPWMMPPKIIHKTGRNEKVLRPEFNKDQ